MGAWSSGAPNAEPQACFLGDGPEGDLAKDQTLSDFFRSSLICFIA